MTQHNNVVLPEKEGQKPGKNAPVANSAAVLAACAEIGAASPMALPVTCWMLNTVSALPSRAIAPLVGKSPTRVREAIRKVDLQLRRDAALRAQLGAVGRRVAMLQRQYLADARVRLHPGLPA